MAATIFANCAVLDGTRKERREDHHVVVEGGRRLVHCDKASKAELHKRLHLGLAPKSVTKPQLDMDTPTSTPPIVDVNQLPLLALLR